ncbi:vacuole effluxer Atg22 like-domain-containing protein [Chlamydoabsidia padenii]|nr:vacuole effluxer Atg22 like-domain-containing protein [Chlamydoabsidia padenii]
MTTAENLRTDPFKVEGTVDPTTDIGREVLSQPPATRWELWTYYLYYNGNNGYNMYQFLPTLFQLLAQENGFNPTLPYHPPCEMNTPCNVTWNGTTISVISVTMYATAISFGAQFLLFTTFGPLADYGRFNHYILVSATLISCAAQILPILFINDDGRNWPGMMTLNIIAMVSYGVTLVCYSAAFPILSDNLPLVRSVRADQDISIEKKQSVIERWRSHVSAVSTAWSNVGFLVISAVFAGVSFIPWSKGPFFNSQEPKFGNTLTYYCVASLVSGAYMLINAIPYFICRPIGRRGPPFPKTEHYVTIGWKSIFKALNYFCFSDGVNAISTYQTYIQNQVTGFSATLTTGMGLVGAVTSLIGCFFFLHLQNHFDFSTKTNLMIIVIFTAMIPVWGCFGIGLDHFGIRTEWELWVLAAWSGFFTGPIWAWQQTLFSELVPRGQENLFFALFGLTSRSSYWIAPTMIGAVTEQTTNPYYGWPIIAGLFVIAIIALCFVDMEGAKLEMLHLEIHQELMDNMAAAAEAQRHSFNTTNEKIPIIRMELSSDGGSEAYKNQLATLLTRQMYPTSVTMITAALTNYNGDDNNIRQRPNSQTTLTDYLP